MSVTIGFRVKNNGRVLEKAIKVCGTQAKLARKLQDMAQVKCYPQKVNEWRNRGIIPPYWVRHVSTIVGMEPKKVDPLLYKI